MDQQSHTEIKETLIQEFKLGDLTLPNRIIMAPLTRIRCDPKTGVPNDLLVEYYTQRASAGLIITECAPVSQAGNSFLGCAGIYTQEQVEGWKKVVKAVHEKGTKIFLQIWHAGRAAHPSQTGEPNLSPSPAAIRGNLRKNLPHAKPKEMTKDDIKIVLDQFRQGTLNAKEAGFDGIELVGSGGYLVDQFLRDSGNQRTDEYGGSVENRCRFPLEIMDILVEVFGAKRVGIKLTPVGRFQDMYDSDPIKTYGYFFKELDKRGVGYIHLMEPDEFYSDPTAYGKGSEQIQEVCKTFRPLFSGTIIINNNLTPESAAKAIKEGYADLAAFGRYYIANPDFVERVENNWPFAEPDPTTFYVGGAKGYTDYPKYVPGQTLETEKKEFSGWVF